MISSSQRPLPDNTQHSQQKNIHPSGGIQTHDRSRRAAVDLRLRPRGYCDRLFSYLALINCQQLTSNKQETRAYWLKGYRVSQCYSYNLKPNAKFRRNPINKRFDLEICCSLSHHLFFLVPSVLLNVLQPWCNCYNSHFVLWIGTSGLIRASVLSLQAMRTHWNKMNRIHWLEDIKSNISSHICNCSFRSHKLNAPAV